MKDVTRKILSTVVCYLMALLFLSPSLLHSSAAVSYTGSGTESDPFVVSNATELISVLSLYNTADTYIELDNNITLGSTYVPGIFNANLDGKFHKITATTQFFVKNNGVLKNFFYTDTVERVNVSGSYAGIVCDENAGEMIGIIAMGNINCDCDNTTSDNGTCYASRAGILAGSGGKFVNCAAFGSVSVSCPFGSRAGGISSSGTAINCYSAATVSATGGSRYGHSYQHPVTLGTATNCYYNADVYVGTETGGFTTAEMKSADFISLLNNNPVTADSKWIVDSTNKNSGYPVLSSALNATITSSKTNALLTSSEYVYLSCSDSSAKLYYTKNGANPTTASTAYGSYVYVSGDTTLKVVAYKNGVYSSVYTFYYGKVDGGGTASNPYLIDNEPSLKAIKELPSDAYYALTANIKLTDKFESLGEFRGKLDGRGYKIYNVSSSTLVRGLFDSNYGAIQNLTIETAADNMLVANSGFTMVNYGVISNCHFSGVINGKSLVGSSESSNIASIAANNYGLVIGCSLNGNVIAAAAANAGGIVGYNEGIVHYCNVNGNVDIEASTFACHQGYIGGLVGYSKGEIKYSGVVGDKVYSAPLNYSAVAVGALVGGHSNDSITEDCTENVKSVYYDYAYTEWGINSSNRYTGTSSGNAIPTIHNHDFSVNLLPAVCGEMREYVYSCTCGANYKCEYIDSNYWLGHTNVEYVISVPNCSNAGVKELTCTTCGYRSVAEIPATGHKAGSAVTENRVEPTCSKNGSYQSVKYCVDCHAEISRSTYSISKLAHTKVTLAAKEATCTEDGFTEGVKCSVCNEILTAQTVIPAKGHKAGNLVQENVVEANCVNDGGFDNVSYCVDCHEEIDRFRTDIPALGHIANTTEAKEATCTEDGYTASSKCSVCQAVLVEQQIIPALGHTETILQGKSATCTEDGITEGKQCLVCQEILTAQMVIPAIGHKPGAIVVENSTASTCGAPGSYDEVYYCSGCGIEMSREKKTTEKVPHSESVVSGRAPTCTESGLTDGVICSVCGITLIEQEEIAPVGHKYEIETLTPGCESSGFIDQTCHCGTSIVEILPPQGHDYDGAECRRCGAANPDFHPEAEISYEIKIKQPSRTKITRNDAIILHSEINGELPEGYTITWSVDNNKFETTAQENSSDFLITAKRNGKTTVTVTLLDAEGNSVSSDSIVMQSRAGLFARIGNFFRMIFGKFKLFTE